MGFIGHKSDTKKIVDAHRHDFNCLNVKKYINDRGGYVKYVKSLGGVFEKYADFNYPTQNKKVVTKEQFEEICQYVWGLYDIWGVSYSNGDRHWWNYEGGHAGAMYRGDGPFYTPSTSNLDFSYVNYAQGWSGYSGDTPGIDEMLNPNNKYYAVTNCSQGIFQALKKAGLITDKIPFDPAEYPGKWNKAGYRVKVITDAWQLKVGDIMMYGNYFPNKKAVEQDMSDNFVSPSWFHTNIVGEISQDKKTIYYYDSGTGYTYESGGKCRYVRNYGEKPYEYAGDWFAIRFDSTNKLLDKGFEWKQIGEKFYCYQYVGDNEKIALKSCWKEIPWSKGTDWFYFDDEGVMATGWKKLKWSGGTSWFHFASTGAMDTGWQYLNKKWYYLDPENGNMYENGLKKIKEKWYCFDANGVMQTGTLTRKVKLNASGQLAG